VLEVLIGKIKIMQIVENNLKVDINGLVPNDYNPKPDYNETEELKKEYEKIKDSIRIHGQVDPILVRQLEDVDKYEIVNGFHRWTAMKELDFKEVEVKNLGVISREQAIKMALSTEDTKIPLDIIEVAQLVKHLKEIGDDMMGLPYSLEEMEQKIELLGFDWDSLEPKEESDIEVKTLSIIVTTEQKEIITKAMSKVKEEGSHVKDGRALELICADYLSGIE